MRALLASFVALAVLVPAAHAADLPKQFQGLWVLANVPTKNKCRKEEPKGEDDRPVDAMMSVTGGKIDYYETHCQVQSVKPQQSLNADRIDLDVSVSCSGEGQLWTGREIWHFETIDGKPALAVTQVSQTNYRDERGRKTKPPASMVMSSIWSACSK